MKSIATIPVKSESKRVPRKNFRDFDGRPLYEHFFQKLHPEHPFDEVYVNTDSDKVMQTAHSYNFNVIDRPPYLSEDDANGNDLLLYDQQQVEADLYFQLFVTAPLLKPESIEKAHEILLKKQEYDSVFTVTEEHSFYWYEEEPVNYDPEALPRSQDLTPLIEETTGLYGIRAEALDEVECRIGVEPYMLPVHRYEGLDIDEQEDLEIARYVYQNLFGEEV